MSKPKPARKTRPLLVAVLVVLFVIVGYFGGYYANLAGTSVVLINPSGAMLQGRTPIEPSAIYFEPRYRFAHDVSEFLFWPAYLVDRQLRPDRFTLDKPAT